jgi:hypothetical protein
LFFVAFAIATLTASAVARAGAQATPAPDFGTPPSGEVPILFNDQHVYSKPDKLKKGRVLAALVRGGTILVPLRSMFEQMGATVSYNPSTKTVDVTKPGADVQVTLGKPEVVLNGETRPLDVPPEMYKGSIVVPVRVISESMGAYVLWVADKRLVVVRYLSAPPSPTPEPATPPPATPKPVVPTPAPTAPPTPTPTEGAKAVFFIAGDGLFDPKIYDEFDPGNKGTTSIAGRAGLEIPIDNVSFLAEGTYAQYRGSHGGASGFDPTLPCGVNGQPAAGDPSCVSVLGPASGSAYVTPFTLQDTDIDGRLGIGIANPKIYIVGSYETKYGNYGYPRLTGFGFGLEKAPDFKQLIDAYGSVVYFPNLQGKYIDIFSTPQQLEYRYLKYQAGLTISPQAIPIFLDLGFIGNHASAKQNAPASTNESGFYAGLGLHF